MRRKEREVTDTVQIDSIIAQCDCCRLALADSGYPYIVPLNFGFVREGGKPVFYFHSAAEGRKLELIRKNRCAGFELDTNHLLHCHETACGHTFRFQSIIGAGSIQLVENPQEKVRALQLILRHYTGKDDWHLESTAVSQVTVIRLEAEELCCKQHD